MRKDGSVCQLYVLNLKHMAIVILNISAPLFRYRLNNSIDLTVTSVIRVQFLHISNPKPLFSLITGQSLYSWHTVTMSYHSDIQTPGSVTIIIIIIPRHINRITVSKQRRQTQPSTAHGIRTEHCAGHSTWTICTFIVKPQTTKHTQKRFAVHVQGSLIPCRTVGIASLLIFLAIEYRTHVLFLTA